MIDYSILTKQISRAYKEYLTNDPIWTIGEFIEVITYYFSLYNKVFKRDHPILKTETLAEVMYKLPRDYEDEFSDYHKGYIRGDYVAKYEPIDYMDNGVALILRYFYTDFEECNYSICHFVSGDIRKLRMYEAMGCEI